jgi:hypothetical protein
MQHEIVAPDYPGYPFLQSPAPARYAHLVIGLDAQIFRGRLPLRVL